MAVVTRRTVPLRGHGACRQCLVCLDEPRGWHRTRRVHHARARACAALPLPPVHGAQRTDDEGGRAARGPTRAVSLERVDAAAADADDDARSSPSGSLDWDIFEVEMEAEASEHAQELAPAGVHGGGGRKVERTLSAPARVVC